MRTTTILELYFQHLMERFSNISKTIIIIWIEVKYRLKRNGFIQTINHIEDSFEDFSRWLPVQINFKVFSK